MLKVGKKLKAIKGHIKQFCFKLVPKHGGIALSKDGKEFQACTPATGNAQCHVSKYQYIIRVL